MKLTISPLTHKPLFFIEPATEEEEINVSNENDENELSLYVNLLASEIYDMSLTASAREQHSERLFAKTNACGSQLNVLPYLKPVEHKNTQCLKQEITDSKLTPTSSFADRKTRFAQCVQMTDYLHPEGIYQCLRVHTKGLNPEQKKELMEFIPNALVGKSSNELFAPFAALSQLIKVSVKALYLSGVSNGCIENDPHHYQQCVKQVRDTFEGRDPAINQLVRDAIPECVAKAASLLAEGDSYLKKFDQFMFDQFRTIPGIVHEGVYGMVDAALPSATSAAIQGTKLLAKGAIRAADLTAESIAELAARQALVPAYTRAGSNVGMVTRFVRDEAGSIPTFSFTTAEKKMKAILRHKQTLAAEKARLSILTEQKPKLTPPISDTRTLNYSDYTQHAFHRESLKATLLLKKYDDRLLYVHRTHFGSKLLIDGNNKLPGMEKMRIVVEQLVSYSQWNSIEKVMIAWNPAVFPMIKLIESKGLTINSIGSITSVDSKILSIMEITVPKITGVK